MLFVGDDWSEENHDVELMDASGRTLARARLKEGAAGIARLHAMIGEHAGEDDEPVVRVGIETDRGLWVMALAAAGYEVFAINPLQTSRYRDRHGVSGGKSDTGDAHVLADMVRTDSHQLRQAAADTPAVQAVKVVARAHKTLIWERTRHVNRLRHQLLDFFPAAVNAFDDLDAPGAAGQSPGPGVRGETDHCAGLRGPQAGRAPQHHRPHGGDPGRVPQPAAGPAAAGHARVRVGGPGAGRGTGHAERADHGHGIRGRCPFFAAPGR